MLKDRLTIDGPICKISQRCGGPFKAINWVLTTVVSVFKQNSSAYMYLLQHISSYDVQNGKNIYICENESGTALRSVVPTD